MQRMVTYRTGFYGKLPVSPEFLRHNAAGPTVQLLDAWLQAGMLQGTPVAADRFPSDGDPWQFLYSPQGETHFMLGVLQPSRDSVGREFPFLAFLLGDAAVGLDPPWLAPFVLHSFLMETEQALERFRSDQSWTQLRGSLEDFVLDEGAAEVGKVRYKAALQQPARAFWTQIFGDFSHPAKYALDKAMMISIASMKRSGTSNVPWALKFPLVSAVEKEPVDVPFWMDLSACWLGARTPVSLLLWTRRTVAPSLLAAFGKPPARLLRLMLHPEVADEACFDLAPTGADTSAAGGAIDPRRRILLDQGDASLAAFLAQTSDFAAHSG